MNEAGHSANAPERQDSKPVLEYARPMPLAKQPWKPNPPAARSLRLALCAWGTLGLACCAGTLTERLWLFVLIGWLILSITSIYFGHQGLRRARAPEVRGRAQAIVALVLAWLGIAIVALSITVLSQLGRSQEGYTRRRCASNLRQIGQGIRLYADDNRGVFPARLELLISEYDMHPEIFVCWSSNDDPAQGSTIEEKLADFQKPGRNSFIYLGAGMSLATVSPGTIIAHEKLKNHEEQGMNILFGDFHVEWVKRAEMERILAELKMGHNPPRPKDGGGR